MLAHRDREQAREPPEGARGRGRRCPGRERPGEAGGVRRAARRRLWERRARERAHAALQEPARPLQVPATHLLRRGAPEDRYRQDPALPPPPDDRRACRRHGHLRDDARVGRCPSRAASSRRSDGGRAGRRLGANAAPVRARPREPVAPRRGRRLDRRRHGARRRGHARNLGRARPDRPARPAHPSRDLHAPPPRPPRSRRVDAGAVGRRALVHSHRVARRGAR